jgi:hypothetical protein
MALHVGAQIRTPASGLIAASQNSRCLEHGCQVKLVGHYLSALDCLAVKKIFPKRNGINDFQGSLHRRRQNLQANVLHGIHYR